jgi:hypothetical protein
VTGGHDLTGSNTIGVERDGMGAGGHGGDLDRGGGIAPPRLGHGAESSPGSAVGGQSPATVELERLFSRRSPTRRLLHGRVELFIGIGAGLGLLHLATGRGGGEHVALSAMLASLVPVFGPVCFVPVVFAACERGRAPMPVMALRLSTVAFFGCVVAAVHLGVWAALAAGTGAIAGPSVGDIPFSALLVVVTTVVATIAYQAPRDRHLAQPVTVAALVVLYGASFVVHGALLTPSLATIRRHLGPGPVTVEVACMAVALTAVALLMRREVREGLAHAPSGSAGAGSPASPPTRRSTSRAVSGTTSPDATDAAGPGTGRKRRIAMERKKGMERQ